MKKEINQYVMHLLINCVYSRSALHELSLKEECTLNFVNVLIMGLCNSLTNCWFGITLLLIVPPLVLSVPVDFSISLQFLSKILQTSEARPL